MRKEIIGVSVVSVVLLAVFIVGCGEQAGEAYKEFDKKCEPYERLYCAKDGSTLIKEIKDEYCNMKKIPTKCEYGCKGGACLSHSDCEPKEDFYCSGDKLMKYVRYKDCKEEKVPAEKCEFGCEDGACLPEPEFDVNMNSSG